VKASDRRILFGLLGLVAVVAFYLLVISPKRAELSDLKTEVETAESAAVEQEQLAAAAEQAKGTYRGDYQHLVLLGKAVPGDDDVSSLLDQVNSLADGSGIKFNSLKLAAAGDTAAAIPAAPTTPAPESGEESSEPAPSTDATAVPAADGAAPATEAAAAVLPLGAAVGAAGLPTMPYDLTFTGGFFDIADFMAGLDSMVEVRAKGVGVEGRLLTVDGFSLAPSEAGFPELDASLHVTSFVTPADQGLTGGASPTQPAAATPTAPSEGDVPAAPLATTTAGGVR
jgi:Tfp pilus assembly protein PilO